MITSLIRKAACASVILLTAMKAGAATNVGTDTCPLPSANADSIKMTTEYSIRQLPANYVGISSGYAWLENDIMTELGRSRIKSNGFDVNLEYSHLWAFKKLNRPLYYGVAFNGLVSRVDCRLKDVLNSSFKMTSYYIGGGFKMAYKTNKQFVWECLITIGYAHTSDNMDMNSNGGFGAYSELGLGYMVGRKTCLGISCASVSSIYGQPKGWPTDSRYGIDQFALRARLGFFL